MEVFKIVALGFCKYKHRIKYADILGTMSIFHAILILAKVII